MAEKAFIIGCLDLANLCSGNAILVQCDQIQKIEWETKPHTENLHVLQILNNNKCQFLV